MNASQSEVRRLETKLLLHDLQRGDKSKKYSLIKKLSLINFKK